MTARARSLFVAVAACAAIAAVAAFFARETLQRAYFVAQVQRASGLALEVGSLAGGNGSFQLTNVRAHTTGGALVFEAPSARATLGDGRLDLVLDRPRVAAALDRMRGDELAHAGLRLTVEHGTLTLVSGAVPRPLAACDDLHVALEADGAHVRFELDARLRDGTQSYPFESRPSVRADGSPAQLWSAALLPLAPLRAALAAQTGLNVTGGSLRDAALDVGVTLRASARLEDVGFELGTHRLDSLHGALRLADRALGTKQLVGRLDGTVPFDASGEVHDLPADYAVLGAGSNDLRALGRLLESIAAEPRVRSAHLEATAPGVAFGQYALDTEHGPLAVSVLSADPAEPTLRIDTVIAEDHVISGGERTSAMALRTHAIAGVNGDYFDIGRTYQPQGMLVRSGRLVRGPTDRAALVIDKANHVRFEEFHLHGIVKTSRGAMPLTSFNDWPPGEVAVITRDFGRALPPSATATFVALASVDASGKRFRVTSVAPPGSAPRIEFGIAIGPLVRVPVPRVGEIVALSYDFDPPLAGAAAGVGGGPILLRDGAWYEDPHAPAPDERLYRWPVLALAREADDRLLLVAVDGRHPERSVGATRPEFAALLQRLGAVDAMALDSGGSVTLVSRAPGDANASVRNVPSDNSAERWVSDALFLYSSAPPATIVPLTRVPTPPPEKRPAP